MGENNENVKKYTVANPIEDIVRIVTEKENEGKIILQTPEGLMEVNLDDFIKQPAEGILYDLNRDKATVLTFINEQKWINDYAVGLVIAKLKSLLSEKPL